MLTRRNGVCDKSAHRSELSVVSDGSDLSRWRPIIWQIVATEKATGKRILLATADNETERVMILRQERKEKRYETVKAVRVWN